MEVQHGRNDKATSIASTLSWNTFLSRTSVSSLSSAAFSDPRLSDQVHGLDDIFNTVKALSLRRFQYEEITRQSKVGEGETFVVERCLIQNQVLAIKHLKTNQSPDDGMFRRRLQSIILELRIMRHAPLREHPNILNVFGYGWHMTAERTAPYLLVQYAPYGTLRQYLQHYKSKPEEALTRNEILLGDVAAAMSALHLCGIVHGDLKLDNVLVFRSSDRISNPVAKIADFGHSLIVSGVEDSNQNVMRYGGTFVYNAPEVHNQQLYPIDRELLHKCDVWAFGLLVWETFLDGDEYVKHVPEIEQLVEIGADSIVEFQDKLLGLAKDSLPFSKLNLRANLIRAVFSMTLQLDPTRRSSDLIRLPFMSKWHDEAVRGLEVALALHFGNSEWSYEMFRPENGAEILWQHEKQIYQELERTYSSSRSRNSDAAWQLALCHYLGFGDSPNLASAYHLALAAEKLNHPVAKLFVPILALDGPPESYTTSRTYAKRIADLLQQKSITEKSHLIKACCEGDIETILATLDSGNVSDDKSEGGCNILHFLFVLEDDPKENDLLQSLYSNQRWLPLNQPANKVYTAHSQWPLRLVGSPLAFAISVGSTKTVHWLLSLGASPCSRAFASDQFPLDDQRSQWTPVHVAVQYHCHEILSEFLKIASTVGYESEVPYACALSYSSVLERIAIHGNNHRDALEKTISILMKSQKLSATTSNGMTALMQAIDFHDVDVVSVLLNTDFTLALEPFRNPRDHADFVLPIHFAAQIGARRDIPEALRVIEIINTFSHDMNSKRLPLDSIGRTPLHLAVTGASSRVASWILDRRPGLLFVEDDSGRTALHPCSSTVNANLLLSKGADVDYTDKFGFTTLHIAYLQGNIDVVRCLLKEKPLLNLKNNSFGTPLHCAIVKGSLDVTASLLEAGAAVDEVNQFGDSPLHTATSSYRYSIIRLLIQHGADIHQVDSKGRTAAMRVNEQGTVSSLITLRILQGGDTTHDTTATDVFYEQYLQDDMDDDVHSTHETRTESLLSDSASYQSNTVVGTDDFVDYADLSQTSIKEDDSDLEPQNRLEPEDRERKLIDFTYYIYTHYHIHYSEARVTVRDLVKVLAITKLKKFESISASCISLETCRVLILGGVGESLRAAILVAKHLRGITQNALAKLCSDVQRRFGTGDHSLHGFGLALAIILELGRPVWELWDLDSRKVTAMILFGKWIDYHVATCEEVATRLGIPFIPCDSEPPLPNPMWVSSKQPPPATPSEEVEATLFVRLEEEDDANYYRALDL